MLNYLVSIDGHAQWKFYLFIFCDWQVLVFIPPAVSFFLVHRLGVAYFPIDLETHFVMSFLVFILGKFGASAGCICGGFRIATAQSTQWSIWYFVNVELDRICRKAFSCAASIIHSVSFLQKAFLNHLLHSSVFTSPCRAFTWQLLLFSS